VTTQLSVLMPAYNESDCLAANLRATLKELDTAPANSGVAPFEIIVVDDGSTDGTAAVAEQVALMDARLRVVSYPGNIGKGGALRRGFECAQGRWVAFLDADLDLHPCLLFTMIGIQRQQCADAVIGSKQHPASRVNYSRLRRLYSLCYYALVRVLFDLPIRDTQTGIKLFRREVLAYAFPKMRVKRYAFDLELLVLAHQAGYLLAEAPVTVASRRLNQRIRVKDVMAMLMDTFSIWWRVRLHGQVRS
jgi:glycosyltransferase involved in cell wall biosynthesis